MTASTSPAPKTARYESGDWLFFVLLRAMALCLPLVIAEVGWIPNAPALVPVSLLATVVGVLFALSPLPNWLIWLVGTSLGVVVSAHVTAQVLPPLRVVLNDLVQFAEWLIGKVSFWKPDIYIAYPFQQTLAHLGERLDWLYTKVLVWYSVVYYGGTSQETITLFLAAALVIWLLTFFACTELLRHRRTFLAAIPLGLAVVLNVAYTGIGLTYVYAFLALTLVTQVWAHARQLERLWKQQRTDYSPEIKRDLVITGVGVTALIILVALIIPYFTFQKVVLAFWDNVGSKLQPFYSDWDRAFAGRNPVPTATPEVVARGEGHEVTSPLDLPGNQMILIVTTSAPPPLRMEERNLNPELRFGEVDAKHYWRQITYDTYTGSGWINKSEVETVNYPADQPWTDWSYPSRILTTTITIVQGSPVMAFAVNQPLMFDNEFQLTLRSEGDIESISVVTSTYTAISAVPAASVDELKAASTNYPTWVTERYLPLPDVPQRVIDLANQIVAEAEAETPYDKARAIETYIRTYVYDLEVPRAALNQDVVDYFLFDARRGYCDYSASAMVVMLRAVGVPARYASGFAMGEYDHDRQAYIVRESSAHAWTEVFFPGYGWIEFEPTPSQSTFTYRGLGGNIDTSRFEAATPVPAPAPRIPDIAWIGLAVVLLLAIVIIWPFKWLRDRDRSPRHSILHSYECLVDAARWIDFMPTGGQTPANYLFALANEIEARSSGRLSARRDLDYLRDAYLEARYSEAEIDAITAAQSDAARRRASSVIRRAFFGGDKRRKTFQPG